MTSPLVPCSGCGRHVRASEEKCPFCAHAIESTVAAPGLPVGARLGRAALFAVGVAVAAGSAACGPMTGGNDAAVDQDVGNMMALYGAPVMPDGGADGGPVARYGAPPAPTDASTDV